ncbi:unnamed protein product [Chrysoparadoxa australica]
MALSEAVPEDPLPGHQVRVVMGIRLDRFARSLNDLREFLRQRPDCSLLVLQPPAGFWAGLESGREALQRAWEGAPGNFTNFGELSEDDMRALDVLVELVQKAPSMARPGASFFPTWIGLAQLKDEKHWAASELRVAEDFLLTFRLSGHVAEASRLLEMRERTAYEKALQSNGFVGPAQSEFVQQLFKSVLHEQDSTKYWVAPVLQEGKPASWRAGSFTYFQCACKGVVCRGGCSCRCNSCEVRTQKAYCPCFRAGHEGEKMPLYLSCPCTCASCTAYHLGGNKANKRPARVHYR